MIGGFIKSYYICIAFLGSTRKEIQFMCAVKKSYKIKTVILIFGPKDLYFNVIWITTF